MSDHASACLRINAVAKVDGALEHIRRDEIPGIPQNNHPQTGYVRAIDPIRVKQFVRLVAKMKEISGHECSSARRGSAMVSQPPKADESFGNGASVHWHLHRVRT
jgi:hypothetical protein